MGIDVQIADSYQFPIGRPSLPMYKWLDKTMGTYNIRYGWLELTDTDAIYLGEHFPDDAVAQMILQEIERQNTHGHRMGATHTVEIMISI